MSKTTVNELKRLITELSNKRQEYVDAIAEIDQTFAALGISSKDAVAAGKPRRGRKPGPKPGAPKAASTTGKKRGPKPGSKRGRKRGSFAISGEESVLNFVKSAGQPNAKEVNAHWQKEGRAGKADNALSKLVKDGTLKRVEVEGERGGRYTAA